MTRNPVYHGRTKYVDIMVNYVRYLVIEEQVVLDYPNTNKQAADILTKSFSKYSRRCLGVCDSESREGVVD